VIMSVKPEFNFIDKYIEAYEACFSQVKQWKVEDPDPETTEKTIGQALCKGLGFEGDPDLKTIYYKTGKEIENLRDKIYNMGPGDTISSDDLGKLEKLSATTDLLYTTIFRSEAYGKQKNMNARDLYKKKQGDLKELVILKAHLHTAKRLIEVKQTKYPDELKEGD